MPAQKSVWGIDIGQCALKALKLGLVEGGKYQVEAIDLIEHPKILSQPDADRMQLVRTALEQFLARNKVVGSLVAVSVPGQTSFTRFVKLPPVETKKVPDIVRFEAEQQIPFAIEDVVWRWQTFQDANSPDVEVGIFAMKRTDISEALEHFARVELNVDVVQMAPLALYNFMKCDEQASGDGATLLADVGADKIDLVVADGPRIWTRTIQIGGRNFTEALERAFKLSFPKAEKLKRTAATSKYARQVFQAMRPVFAELVQEIQRSLGYYMSLHRETRFARLLGLGNGFRLPGLQKFLEQNLGVPVVRIDSFNRVEPSATVNAPMFAENVLSFAVAYGLALQGLGQTTVSTNLLPGEIARRRRWRSKRPWFAAAAGLLVLALAGWTFRAYADYSSLTGGEELEQAVRIKEEITGLRKKYQTSDDQRGKWVSDIGWYRELYQYRSFWPQVTDMVLESIRRVAKDQLRLADDPAKLSQLVRDRAARGAGPLQVVIVEEIKSLYVPILEEKSVEVTAGKGLAGGPPGMRMPAKKKKNKNKKSNVSKRAKKKERRGFKVRMVARTPLSEEEAVRRIITPLQNRSMQVAAAGDRMFTIVDSPEIRVLKAGEKAPPLGKGAVAGRTTAVRPGRQLGFNPGGGGGPAIFEPGRDRGREDEAKQPPKHPLDASESDTRFTITWVLEIKVDESPAGGRTDRRGK